MKKFFLLFLFVLLFGISCDKQDMPTQTEPNKVELEAAWEQRIEQAHLREHPAFDYVHDNPELPRILIIGDSISIGYTAQVRELLKGKANVHRAPTNCGPTDTGLIKLDDWINGEEWDIIHFNFGLHDMKHIDANGLSDTGKQVNTVEKYAVNLDQIAVRLKTTNATIIFATTTPTTEGTTGFKSTDPSIYNSAAIEIMNKYNIAVNDLYNHIVYDLDKYQIPKNVHFNNIGCDALAKKVAGSLEVILTDTK